MSGMSRSDINRAADRARGRVDGLANRARGIVDDASTAGSHAISRIEEAGKQAWDISQKYGTHAQHVAGEVSARSSRGLRATSRQVRSEPFISILVAAAIGYFLAAVLHRR